MNPLLANAPLPLFSQVKAEHIMPALRAILASNREQIAAITAQQNLSWDNLVQPLEEMHERLHRCWSTVHHLHAVVDNPSLRDVYNACLPELTAYHTEIGQNQKLYQAYQALSQSEDYALFNQAQKQLIQHALRDFRLAGVALEGKAKERYKQLAQNLGALTARFEQNVLDATHAWCYHTADKEGLQGIPEHAMTNAEEAAKAKGLSGWLFTLDFPSYYSVVAYATDRRLRERFYTAYVTRASDLSPSGKQWDNSAVMEEILACRHELAQLLDYNNYADYSLVTKMAKSSQQVLDFLSDFAKRARPMAEQEWDTLQQFAKEQDKLDEIAAWDIAYYSEKLCKATHAIDQEELRPYFPEDRVLQGLFQLVQTLYGIQITEIKSNIDTWHPHVKFYQITAPTQTIRGYFYLDLYARANKRGGAWMDDYCHRHCKRDGTVQLPVAYLTCNFSRPLANGKALLTHEEVLTLFHEFGHGLHHLLSKIDYPSVSGISGVAWDAVEFPSQIMENWAWERSVLALISSHHQTGEALPDALYERMLAAKNFQVGMQMLRQIEFSLFDFRMHLNYDPKQGGRIQETLDQVRNEISVVKPPAYNRFQNSFNHIFSGGYAAAYYSYKWAEVLSSDAYSLFEERGVLDPATGQHFLKTVLEQGGAKDAMDLFIAFRGREPRIDALLRHSGITS